MLKYNLPFVTIKNDFLVGGDTADMCCFIVEDCMVVFSDSKQFIGKFRFDMTGILIGTRNNGKEPLFRKLTYNPRSSI